MPDPCHMKKTAPSNWWTPENHRHRRPILLARNRMQQALRQWFHDQGFVEVTTSCLQRSPCAEIHLHAFRTTAIEPDGTPHTAYLHTSPEFACKKLLAAGEPAIFTFAPVFRNRERGRLHAPEFMMLEWYRAIDDFELLLDDCEEIVRLAAQAVPADTFRHRDAACPALAKPKRLTVAEAFAEFAGINLGAYLAQGASPVQFAELVKNAGLRIAADDSWSDLFSRVLTERIEPNLGKSAPTFLTHYPASEAALARLDPANPATALRAELYICGVEVANGFAELSDGDEQRSRIEAAMDVRAATYGEDERYPIDPDFLDAVERMPPSIGCALGFDRLVMLATGAPTVSDVAWTPVDI